MSSQPLYGLPAQDLADLFPFHFVIDADLRVLQAGQMLNRLCNHTLVGASVTDHFRLLRPTQHWSKNLLNRLGTLFMMEHVERGFVLKGELRVLRTEGAYLFVGTPWITDLSEMQQLGLSIADFPIHDPISDYLFLLQTKNTALAESERLAAAITAQRMELRVTNRMLLAQFEVSQGLVDAKSSPEAWNTLLAAVTKYLGWDLAALWVDEPGVGLQCVAALGKHASGRETEAPQLDQGVVLAARSKRDMICAGTARWADYSQPAVHPPYRNVLALPLPGMQETLAFLQVFRDDDAPVERSAMETLLSICARVGQFLDRQRVQQALYDERARLQAVLSHTGAFVYSVDPKKLCLTFISDNAEQILGYKRREILATTIGSLDFLHPDDQRRVRTALADLARGPCSVDYRIRRADGTYQWRSDFMRLVASEHDGTAEVFGASLDLSARKDAEAALHESEARLRAVLDNAAEGILAIDTYGKIQLCNTAAARLLERNLPEVVGVPVSQLPVLSPLVSPSASASGPAEQPILQTGVHELEGTRADGSPYLLQFTVSAVANEERRLWVGILRDRTAEQAVNRELQRAKAAAESAYRAKSEFLAVVSHEIRTPLNIIMGMTELALATKSPSEQQEFLGRVRANADALLHLIHSMLDLSKIEASLLEIETVPFDCAQLLGNVADAVAARLTSGQVELVCAVTPRLPRQLLGDPIRLRQILLNLLGNATKFTEHGEIQLIVELVEHDEGSARVRFTVRDTGIGIPKAVQSRIFERFFQADSSTSRRFGGSGLGLTISRSLVEMMGGRIWFDSEPGRGTSFYFEVPFVISEPSSPQQKLPSNGMEVLIVDDSEVSRGAMTEVLQHQGFNVASAPDAQSALALLQGHRFHAIVLDRDMPGPGGIDLAAQLAADESLQPTRLILTSPIWAPTPSLPTRYGRHIEHLIRPVSSARLLEVVERSCGLLPKQEAVPAETAPALRLAPRPYRILVVEDNIDNQRLAWHALTKAGYQPELAENGAIAVKKADEREYDMILMDIEMPELDGFDATARIRLDEARRGSSRVPIVAVTAHAVPAFRQRCLDAGMDDYATKPMSRQRLLEIAAQWVDRRPTILIADDAADERVLLRELLRQIGSYRIVFASSGREAVELARRIEPALVLIDLEMPLMDGYQAVASLRALANGKDIPILGITSQDASETSQRAVPAGCSGHIGKPVRARELQERVFQFISGETQAQAAPASTGPTRGGTPQSIASVPPVPTTSGPTTGAKDSPLVGSTQVAAAPMSDGLGFVKESVAPEILDLVPAYLMACRADLERLVDCLAKGNFQAVVRTAHNWKGTASSYGFPTLGQLAAGLEQAAIARDNERTQRLLREIASHIASLPDVLP